MTSGPTATAEVRDPAADAPSVASRAAIYGAFFATGAAALTLEMLWSRQLVTVFGNSSYAISVVLCAYMSGLGLGAWGGGRLADRIRRRLAAFGLLQAGVAVWALGLPMALGVARSWAAALPALRGGGLLLPGLVRFGMSLGLLFVPCALMGATLPLLTRHLAESRAAIGRRVGMLYGLNTLGAAAGCFGAGFWAISYLGLAKTNLVAAGVCLAVAAGTLGADAARRRRGGDARAPDAGHAEADGAHFGAAGRKQGRAVGPALLTVAFVSGMVSLVCEVAWVRYLAFISSLVYAFTVILGLFLLGQAAGSLLFRLLLAGRERPVRMLGVVELALGIAVGGCFVGGAVFFANRDPGTQTVGPVAAAIMLAPTVLMGMAFPLVCSAYAASVRTAGARVGKVYALNTAGTIVGALLPVFVLIPLVGAQWTILGAALVYGAMGVLLLGLSASAHGRRRMRLAAVPALTAVVALACVTPGDLCQRIFLAAEPDLAMHTDLPFFREGRTGTAAVARDKVSGFDRLYINGVGEVPTTYSAMHCFKLLGGLGPLLHPRPDRVLMICFGGGIAAGATLQYPQVESLEIVDLESSVVEAAELLTLQNNGVLDDPKVRVVIDDGRNYIRTSPGRWPVIVCDSTHPKASDSWVLYTTEFYQGVADHLAVDGVFVQWLPLHGLTQIEYRVILRTFQSVFPHASVWISSAVDETGSEATFSLLVATPRRLSIDWGLIRSRLAEPAVARDLAPVGLARPIDIARTFACGEDAVCRWTGDVPPNTDDLPYTQYRTHFSKGAACTPASLVPHVESAWPYVTNLDGSDDPEALRAALERCVIVNRLVLTGRLSQALAMEPESAWLRKCSANYERGQRYLRALGGLYAADAYMLRHLAALASLTPDGSDLALSLLRDSLAVEPGCAEAQSAYAALLADQGHDAEAMSFLMDALRTDPDNAQALNGLGLIHWRQGELDTAIDYFRRAVDASPRFAVALNNLGFAIAETGDVPAGMALLRRSAAISPNEAEVHKSLALLLAESGRLEDAVTELHRALEVQPGDAVLRCSLADALMDLGRRDEAAEHFRIAVQIAPNLAEARRGLSRAGRTR
jgi:spermidine synthase